MSSKAKFTYTSISQANDSASVIFQPRVEVPESVKINVERPDIKLLEEPQDEPTAPERNTNPVSQQEPPGNNTVLQEELNQEEVLDDTLDRVLIHDWVESGLDKQLWVSASNDSACTLPLNYFHNETSNERPVSDEDEKQQDMVLTKPGQKAAETIEEIDISDPSLVSEKNYEEALKSQDWFLVVIVGLVAITGMVRFKWQKYMNEVFSAVLFSNVAVKLQNNSSRSYKAASFWMGFLFYASFSVLFFETMRLEARTFLGLSGWQLLTALMLFLVIVFTLKLVVYRFVGWLFNVRKPVLEYLYQSSIMSKAFGIILMPLVVVFPFMEVQAREWIPTVGFTIFIILYLMQIGRGIGANLRNTLSGYYIILYLCALEILPLTILYKVLFY